MAFTLEQTSRYDRPRFVSPRSGDFGLDVAASLLVEMSVVYRTQLNQSLLALVGLFILSATLLGQDRLPVVAEVAPQDVVADQVTVAVHHAKSTLRGVLALEPVAIQSVFADYLVPAALALLALIVGYMIAAFVGRIVGTLVADNVDITLGKFVGRMVSNAIVLLIGIGVLGWFGVETSSFAAILAAAGFAIGMALQGTLSNFAAGVMLLVFRPFKVHDFIIIEGASGKVEEIELFTTKLNTSDNRHLIVPNSQVFGATIENVTRNDRRRVEVNVGVAYSADLRQTRQVLTDAINMIPGALREPAPQVYLVDLGDSAVNWQLRVWCRPTSYWDVRERVTAAAKDSLDTNGIGIPYPQMDIHVASSNVGLKAA